MPDPVFKGYSTWLTEGETSVSSMEVTIDVNGGDLVLALVQRNAQANCTGVTLGSQDLDLLKSSQSGFEIGLDIWGAMASASGTGVSITATYSDSDQFGSMVALKWNNVSSSTPSQSSCVVSACDTLADSSSSRTAQEITTSARSLIVAVGSDWNDYHTHTGANGFTKEWDTSVAGGDQIQWAYAKVANAGSFGGESNFGTTDNGSDQYLGALLAFDILSDKQLTHIIGFMKFSQFSLFSNIGGLGYSGGKYPACTPYFGHTYRSSLGGNPSFARSSIGTYLDPADGLIKTASANVPRYQADGLLFEIAEATNVYRYSVDTTIIHLVHCVTDTGKDSPSGDTSAYAVITNAESNPFYFYKNADVVSGTQYVLSVYVKPSGYDFLQLAGLTAFSSTAYQNFNLSTGELGHSSGAEAAGIIDIGNGWYRCYLALTANANSGSGQLLQAILNDDIDSRIPTYLGDGVSGLVFWGPQLEVGAYPTSYIETVDATPVTRAAETLSYSGINATNETRASVDIYDGNGFQNVDVDNWDGKVDSNIITGSASPAIVKKIIAYPVGCRPL